jgi:hypothetical protein
MQHMVYGCQNEIKTGKLAKWTYFYEVAETWIPVINPVDLKIKIQ